MHYKYEIKDKMLSFYKMQYSFQRTELDLKEESEILELFLNFFGHSIRRTFQGETRIKLEKK
jgi:hypothetical protein